MVRSRSKRSDLLPSGLAWGCWVLSLWFSVGRPPTGRSCERWSNNRGRQRAVGNGRPAWIGDHLSGGAGAELGMVMGGLGTSTLEIGPGASGAFQGLRVQNNWSGAVADAAASFLSHPCPHKLRKSRDKSLASRPGGADAGQGPDLSGAIPLCPDRVPGFRPFPVRWRWRPFVPLCRTTRLPFLCRWCFSPLCPQPNQRILDRCGCRLLGRRYRCRGQSGGASRLGRWELGRPDCGPAVLMGMRGKEFAGFQSICCRACPRRSPL